MPESANRDARNPDPRGSGDCQRARRKSYQDRLAVLHTISAKQIEPALSAGQ